MVKLDLRVFTSGPLETNNYLIFDKRSRKAFIIDLSSPSGEIFDFLKKEKLEVDFVALTHAHFDHIQGLEHTDFPFYIQRQDLDLISDPETNGSAFFSISVKIEKKPFIYGKKVKFSDSEIEVIHTPGHTPGSVSLRLNKWLFTGDALFSGSIGRTDLPLASNQLLLKSIKEKILVLPDDIIIYPGHGPSSTLLQEKKFNPFLTTESN